MNRAVRVVVVAIAAAGVGTLLFPLYLGLLAGERKVFEPQIFDFVLVAVGVFGVVAGVQLVPWRAAANVAVLAALAALVGGGLLLGALAILSIGAVVLLVAIVLLVLLVRSIRRAPRSIARPAALGGAVVGYGLVLLFIALIIPPTVECLANGGGSTSSQRWGSGGYTATSSGTSTVDGVQTGRIESFDSVATYRCEQGRIAEFRRESR